HSTPPPPSLHDALPIYINYYLATRPPKFYTAVTVGAILALGYATVFLLLFTRWLYSLPLVLFRHKGVFLCMRESAHLARDFFWRDRKSTRLNSSHDQIS